MNIFKKANHLTAFWALEAVNKDNIDFAVGGQAVIEGVMMRSPNHISIAVRKQNDEIKVDKRPYKTLTQKFKLLNLPLLRGVINLFEMMIIGMKAINFSANESLEEEGDAERKRKMSKRQKTLATVFETFMMIFSFIVAIALSITLFKMIPLWVTTFFEGKTQFIKENYIIFNLIDGILKMTIFLFYIYVLSLAKSFRRVFEYHGAEHKSIFTYEQKKELSIENAKKQTRFHPRCGTSFILIVFITSILVYTFVPKQDDFWINLSLRLAFLPLIAGISYEYLKFSAKHTNRILVKILSAPGLWFQRLTTKEPDEKQLEVGLKSLKEALAMENKTT
jgi:uncharacterized protein YqhQ